MRRAVRGLLFPATLCAVMSGAIAALAHGVSTGVVLGAGAALAWLVVVLLERAVPFRREWNRPQGDLAADVAYLPTSVGVNAAVEPGLTAAAAVAGGALSGALGVGLWPTAWPAPAQLVLACGVAELFDYWAHRWMHERPWLWRLHTIHHSPERLYWLNATRAHPLETAFRSVFNIVPLALLGAGGDAIALFALANIAVGLFQHANVDFALGPLAWIFSVGEMHRWHHSRTLAEANHNYGNNFLFWDVVFGTWYRPRGARAPARLGVAGLEGFPRSWLGQLAAPFRPARPAD